MKLSLSLLAICLCSMLGAGALALHQRGLLSRDLLRLYQASEREKEEEPVPTPAPMGLAASLQEKERSVERRYQEAQDLEEKLKLQRRELEQERMKIHSQLQALQQAVDPRLEQGIETQGMADLVKIYEGMEAEGTASILENLSTDTAALILLQMRGRQASRVMESLSTPKAVAISAEIIPERIAKNK